MTTIGPSSSTRTDIAMWKHLAREVEREFGADMASNEKWLGALQKHLDAGTALWATDTLSGEILGGMWLTESAATLRIAWLAVFRAHRRKGVGRALVIAAINRSRGRPVEVVTFGKGHPQVAAAKAATGLYHGAEFERVGSAPDGPDGTPRALFRRAPN